MQFPPVSLYETGLGSIEIPQAQVSKQSQHGEMCKNPYSETIHLKEARELP